jgi:predicted ribosome quality control (RQC) complex YloA/Tae2 family protein
MNNFYTLIYLTEELKAKCLGAKFQFSISPHKDVWDSYFEHENDSFCVRFSAHSAETALFPDKYRPPKKSNITHFFSELENDVISNVTLANNDRFISFHFHSGYTLLFRLFGNHPNVFLTQSGLIIDSFKNPDDNKGQDEPQPRGAPKPKELKESMSAKQVILATDMKFPRHLIKPVIDHYQLDKASPQTCRDITHKVTESILNRPEFRVASSGNICLPPHDVLPVSAIKQTSTVSEAIRYVYYKTSQQRRLSSKKSSVEPALEKQINKLSSIIEQLKQADKGFDRAEKYEQFGHILMAHAHEKLDPGKDEVEFENFYAQNEKVVIPVKPNRSIAENAQNYYDKSADTIKNIEESKRRLKEAEQELKKVENLKKSFENIEKVYEFDEWFNEHEEELKATGVLSKASDSVSLPYRSASIDGYEIWIGKNAKSNDQLTSDAHKEDVWLHARGVGGSHVVIRMNNQKEMPPKNVILRAASIAAWNSKARGSGLAPVIVTKRKYITKPKGAPAGTVRVMKEHVEMVPPKKYSA